MNRDYADTSLQSLLNLINEQNGCNLTTERYTLSNPNTIKIENPPADAPELKNEGTNTSVLITNVNIKSDTVSVYYHRLAMDSLLANESIEHDGTVMPEDDMVEVVAEIFKKNGYPFERDKFAISGDEKNIRVSSRWDFIFEGQGNVVIVTDTHLSRVLKVRTLTGYPVVYVNHGPETRGELTFIDNVSANNDGIFDIKENVVYLEGVETLGLVEPTDRAILKSPVSGTPYYGSTYVDYNRWPYDLMRPDGVFIGTYATLDAFIKATNHLIMVRLLRADSGYPFMGSEWTYDDYEEFDTYPHFRRGLRFKGDNYLVKTVGTLYLVGRKSQ